MTASHGRSKVGGRQRETGRSGEAAGRHGVGSGRLRARELRRGSGSAAARARLGPPEARDAGNETDREGHRGQDFVVHCCNLFWDECDECCDGGETILWPGWLRKHACDRMPSEPTQRRTAYEGLPEIASSIPGFSRNRVRGAGWRTGRDSNPGRSFTPLTRLAGGRFRPLSHPSRPLERVARQCTRAPRRRRPTARISRRLRRHPDRGAAPPPRRPIGCAARRSRRSGRTRPGRTSARCRT